MKILLIDDDPFSLRLLSIQLRAFGLSRHGYVDILSCSSGAEACELLAREQDVALVFCDLQMPGMDGVELLRYLERTGYAGGLVLFSGEHARTLQAVGQLAKALGLDLLGTIGKPVSREALQALLERALPPEAARPRRGNGQDPGVSAEEVASAIARGEVVNHYQPKVELATGTIVGMEALARWRHPSLGLIAPQALAPLHGDAELARTMAMGVARQAFRDLRQLHQLGHRIDLAINLSLAALSSIDFPDVLAGEAEAAGVPLHCLVLEVTEGRLMDEPQLQLDILSRLRLKRVRLSMDDFGTGYSCLSQLRDLPFDELKIDRSVVHGMSKDSSLRAMVETSLALGGELGIQAVAEGIEEGDDLELLRELGCHMGQGPLFGGAMPIHEFAGWLQGKDRDRASG